MCKVTIKPTLFCLNKDLFWIRKLWSQSSMHYLNLIWFVSLIWAQNNNLTEISFITDKIPHYNVLAKSKFPHSLIKDFEILQSFDKNAFENCILIRHLLKEVIAKVFSSRFRLLFGFHPYDNRWESLGYLEILFYQSKT